MKSKKREWLTGLWCSRAAHWKAKVAVVLAVTVSAANITPAAVLGDPSHKKKTIKVTFQSGENGYFAGMDEDSSTKSNASKSSANRAEWVQNFYDLEEDDQGYFTNLKLGAEEVEAKNQKPIWETVTNKVNENNLDEDALVFAGWYSFDGEIPMLVSNYKEIYSNAALEAEWYDPEQIEGKAKDKYGVIAIGLEDRKLVVSEPEMIRDIEEVEQWAKSALLKKELKIDGEDLIALELEITGNKEDEEGKDKDVTLTLSVDEEKLDMTKSVSAIHEKEDGKIEIIPADVVKADDGDGYQVTFTVKDSGEYYLVNTGVYRRTLMKAPARANSAAKIDETETREAVMSGTIGENLSWKIENSVLTISGTGDMPDWKGYEGCPWDTVRGEIKKVIIEKGITGIGEYSFFHLYAVTEIQLPEGLLSIDSYAFYNCENLVDVDIPDSVTNIDSSAFTNCNKLAETTIIGRGSFGDSLSWEETKKGELTIRGKGEMPDDIHPWSSINQDIISVDIQAGVTSIGKNAFNGCENLTSVKIPEGVTKIGDSAFLKCTKLEKIDIPESVCYIGRLAFFDTGIISVTIPKSVTFLGQKSFPKSTQIVFKKVEDDTSSESLKPTGNANFVNTNNEHKQNYSNWWKAVINSYLYEGEDGAFYRVEYTSKQLVIEQYKSDNTFTKSWNVPMELSEFGGFYAGNDALYIVFGQNNEKESDDVEVIRVVKYSKNMERLSSVSVYGANTKEVFHSASVQMEEKDDYLYIRTGHTVYTTSDGRNPSANMNIVINTKYMILVCCQCENLDISTGYASSSYNQLVKIDDDKVIKVDHCDLKPKGVVMRIYPSDDLRESSVNVIILPINSGNQILYTGVDVGGLEFSDSSYFVAGNTIDQSNFSTSETRNIFLSVVNKDALDSEAKYIQVTDYKEGGTYSASTPQLVKISEDLFVILWEEMLEPIDPCNHVYTKASGIVKAAFFDGEGKQLGDIQEFKGALSDCQPIIVNGNVKWYVTNGNSLTFYAFPAQEPDFNEGIKISKIVPTTESSGGGSSSGSSSSGGSSSGGGSSSSGGSGGGGGSRGGGGGGSRSVGGSSSSGGPGSSLPSYVEKGEWTILNGVWRFVDASGNAKINTWTAAYNPYAAAGQQNYDWFRFDANGNMMTGWFTDVDGNRYFLNPLSDGTLGKMMTGWVWIADEFGIQRCYYFNPNSDGYRGKLLTNTVVDGYTIDANGCWMVDGVVQVK